MAGRLRSRRESLNQPRYHEQDWCGQTDHHGEERKDEKIVELQPVANDDRDQILERQAHRSADPSLRGRGSVRVRRESPATG
jgi:hypothetical protein